MGKVGSNRRSKYLFYPYAVTSSYRLNPFSCKLSKSMINLQRTSRLSTGVSSVIMGSSYYSVDEYSGALRFLRLDDDAIVHTDSLKKNDIRVF